MKTNSILDEIRRTRDEHAKEFNYDLKAIVADIRRHEKELKRAGWKFARPQERAVRRRKLAA